jgi:hypothetical protein
MLTPLRNARGDIAALVKVGKGRKMDGVTGICGPGIGLLIIGLSVN